MEINYDGRRFRAVSEAADENAAIALYRQEGELLWGESSGGDVLRGALTGRCGPDGIIDFAYSMVLRGGEVVSGRCLSTPEVLSDGRIRLHEKWERFGPSAGSGISYLEELPGSDHDGES